MCLPAAATSRPLISAAFPLISGPLCRDWELAEASLVLSTASNLYIKDERGEKLHFQYDAAAKLVMVYAISFSPIGHQLSLSTSVLRRES